MGRKPNKGFLKLPRAVLFSDYKSNTYSWSKIGKIQKSTKKKIHPYSTTQKQRLLIFEVYHLPVLPFLAVSLSLSFNRSLMRQYCFVAYLVTVYQEHFPTQQKPFDECGQVFGVGNAGWRALRGDLSADRSDCLSGHGAR